MNDEARKRKRRKTAETDGVRKAMPHVAVRLEPELVAEIDAVALELATEWRRANRSDVLRMLLLKGIKAHRAEKAAPPKGDPDPET